MSIGLLSALRERGIRVPEDVSVVGFDDVPEAGYLYPALTTVRQDFAALGELIMQKVLIAVEEPETRDRGHPAADPPDRPAVDASRTALIAAVTGWDHAHRSHRLHRKARLRRRG